MMKPSILFLAALLSSCATSEKIHFKVVAKPSDATIEVNGIAFCGSTPCDLYLACSERWVGVANSPTGRARTSGIYEVVAIPNSAVTGQSLYSQTKRVDPCLVSQQGKGLLIFDLKLRQVGPVHQIEVKGN